MVCGRHWVARRVPDDQVVLLPNYYVTDEVRLDDRQSFLGAADLIEYAYTKEGSKTDNPRNLETLRTIFKLP